MKSRRRKRRAYRMGAVMSYKEGARAMKVAASKGTGTAKELARLAKQAFNAGDDALGKQYWALMHKAVDMYAANHPEFKKLTAAQFKAKKGKSGTRKPSTRKKKAAVSGYARRKSFSW